MSAAKLVNKEEKKGQIISAAIKVFAKKGLQATTIKEIADAAGIGKGTIYEYFRSKEEIVLATLHHFYLLAAGELALHAKQSAKEKLEYILDGFIHFTQGEVGEYLELMFEYWAEAVRQHRSNAPVNEMLSQLYSEFRGLTASILAEGIERGEFRGTLNVEHLASIILGAADGLFLQWYLTHKKEDLLAALNTLKKMVWAAVLIEDEEESK